MTRSKANAAISGRMDARRSSHGGDIEGATRRFGAPSGGWLDLSTGINPQPYPVLPLSAVAWRSLPGGDAEAALVDAARAYYGAPAGAAIVIAPGAQSLIESLPGLRPPCRVTVVGPTYGEHAHCWRRAGHEVREVGALGDLEDADVGIIVNPNNPDGRVVGRETLLRAHRRLAARGGWLVVDEAFADPDPGLSIAGDCGDETLIVLRSFGKFFGLAGLRLGFALTGPRLAAGLDQALGLWAVSGPALEIGRHGLTDTSWAAAVRQQLTDDALALDGLLGAHGLRVVGGTALFRLVECSGAAALFEGLARVGILTRIFEDRPSLIRFGLPGAGFARLAAALAALGRGQQ